MRNELGAQRQSKQRLYLIGFEFYLIAIATEDDDNRRTIKECQKSHHV